MTQQEYDAWYPMAVGEYAGEHVRAGSMPADAAHRMAAEQFAELLSDGLATPTQHLLIGEVDGERVGILWLNISVGDETPPKPVTAFVYDVEVDAAHRGKGYGRALMEHGEKFATAHGAASIKLHVFGDNAVARGLYLSLGYVETNVHMAKALPTGE